MQNVTIMNELNFIRTKANDNLLHNTGYRRPQVHAREPIDSNFLMSTSDSLHTKHKIVELCKLPEEELKDGKALIDRLVRQAGFDKLEEMLPLLELPTQSCLVFEKEDAVEPKSDDLISMITTAVILSKCTNSSYDPQCPMIFTFKRLKRRVQLITIELDAFYGME